jgi:ectoine hydroxylase-related dioxygenase (phytanoyl-CoA dioxygenase family)
LIAKEMIDPNYNELNLVNSNVLIYPAVAGSVYLFPSWLEHSVQTNNSSDDRISVSFNVFFDKF